MFICSTTYSCNCCRRGRGVSSLLKLNTAFASLVIKWRTHGCRVCSFRCAFWSRLDAWAYGWDQISRMLLIFEPRRLLGSCVVIFVVVIALVVFVHLVVVLVVLDARLRPEKSFLAIMFSANETSRSSTLMASRLLFGHLTGYTA